MSQWWKITCECCGTDHENMPFVNKTDGQKTHWLCSKCDKLWAKWYYDNSISTKIDIEGRGNPYPIWEKYFDVWLMSIKERVLFT